MDRVQPGRVGQQHAHVMHVAAARGPMQQLL